MTHLKKGDRVELVHTDDQYTRLQPGDRGTVESVAEVNADWTQIYIDWDDGSHLAMIPQSGDAVKLVRP